MRDRFRDFADDFNYVKRFAGDAKYLYNFGKNIYDTVFRPKSTSRLRDVVNEYLTKNGLFYVC